MKPLGVGGTTGGGGDYGPSRFPGSPGGSSGSGEDDDDGAIGGGGSGGRGRPHPPTDGSRGRSGGGVANGPGVGGSAGTGDPWADAILAAAKWEAFLIAFFRQFHPAGEQWVWANSIVFEGGDGGVHFRTKLYYHKRITQRGHERRQRDAEANDRLHRLSMNTLTFISFTAGPAGALAGAVLAVAHLEQMYLGRYA